MQDRYFLDEEFVVFLDGEKDYVLMDVICVVLKIDVVLVVWLDVFKLDMVVLVDSFDLL